MTEIEIFLFFYLFRKVSALVLHSRCVNVGALSLTTRCTDDAFPFLEGALVLFQGKNEALGPFLKVDEVELYPYYLGEVEFGS